MKNKSIELRHGYLVRSWSGEIEEIFFTIMPHLDYGNIVDKFVIMNKEGVMLESITMYNSDKVFDKEEEALKRSKLVKLEQINYYKKQIVEATHKINTLENSDTVIIKP
jgi:hypothetical protein